MKETGDQSNDEDGLSPLNSPYPQKINFNRIENSSTKKSCIPKLDLTKAKKIQENNIKKAIPIKNVNNKSLEPGAISTDQMEKQKKFKI